MEVTLKAKFAKTFYEITYMQDMTSDVCLVTPTATLENSRYLVGTNGSINSSDIVEETSSKDSNGNVYIYRYANTLAAARQGKAIAQTILTDKRDNKTYLVRKYANGECWMAQNLELDFLDKDGDYITSVTTAEDINVPTTSIDSNWIANSDIEDLDVFNASTNAYAQNKFYATQAEPVSNASARYSIYDWAADGRDGMRSYSTSTVAKTGSDLYSGYAIQSTDSDGNVELGEYGQYLFKASSTGEQYQKTGNYYNFTGATAGYMGNDTSDQNNSICPRNWKLPSSAGTTSFWAIIEYFYGSFDRYGHNTNLYNYLNSAPLDFWITGIYGRNTRDQLDNSHLWAAGGGTSKDKARHLALFIEYGGGREVTVYPDSNDNRGFGISIRCVAR